MCGLGCNMSLLFPCVKYDVCYLLLEGQEVNFPLNCSQVNKDSKIICSVFYLKRS